jgi:TPR repeat protein
MECAMIRRFVPAFASAAMFCAAISCFNFSATAQTPGADDQAARPAEEGSKVAPAADDDARRKFEAFAAKCDQGATAPLDPDGKAAPVHIYTLMEKSRESRLELMEACGQARAGFPDEQRFRLQLARVAFATFDNPQRAIPELRELARAGKPDAMFIVYLDVKNRRVSALREADTVREAVSFLRRAADAGHGHALRELREELRFGIYGKPDIAGALRAAQTMANLPPQGPGGFSEDDERIRRLGKYIAAGMLLDVIPNVSEDIRKAALADIQAMRSPDFPQLDIVHAMAVRKGRGIAANPATARMLMLEYLARGNAFGAVYLADMLAHGEGGPQDLARALQIIEEPKFAHAFARGEVAMRIFMGNKVMGRDPRRAIRAMDLFVNDIFEFVAAANLLAEYNEKTSRSLAPANLVWRLENAAAAGDGEAGLALARLLRSRNSAFSKMEDAIRVLRFMAEAGNVDAQIELARIHFTNLDSTSSATHFAPLVYERDRIAQIINAAAEKQRPAALLLQGELTRKGMIYPQDDRAATQFIARAAEAGHVPAMISLAKAYDDGLGVQKNPRERVRWLRAAAAAGSAEAKDQLGRAFVFDWKDRLLTVREGISEPVAKWANTANEIGPFAASDLSRIFTGSRSREIPRRAMAQAILDGFRIAPAGLSEEKLVAFGRATPEEMRLEIERLLAADGAFKAQPDGYLGPAAREALRGWVAMKGPLPDIASDAAKPAQEPARAPQAGTLPNDVVDRARDAAFKAAQSAKGPQQQAAAVRMLNVLARYGDQPSRWALMRNYHKSSAIRSGVSVEEITRYSLDILVSNPPQVEKADFEYIFNLTEIFKAKRTAAFANAVINTVRDDPRLQDSVALAAIFKHSQMSPGACDAISAALRQRKLAIAGGDCSEAALEALIAFAKSAGSSGVAEKMRAASLPEIRKLAAPR